MDLSQQISPELTARIDQQYQRSRDALDEEIGKARELVEARGPAHAAALLAADHFERSDANAFNLAGALGTLLVELVRREGSLTKREAWPMNLLTCRWCWHPATSHLLVYAGSVTAARCLACPGWPACAWRIERSEAAA